MGVELQAEDTTDVSVKLSEAPPDQPLQPATPQPPVEKLDGAKVRAATIEAARQGLDPFEMVVGDLTKQGQPKPVQAEPPVEVPEKFKKPNGEVDVEKLKVSTERLDEAIQKKEQANQKSIDDYVKAYRAKEAKLAQTPNPEKLQTTIVQTQTPAPMPLDPATIRARIEQDFERDKIGTISDLVEIVVNQRLGQAVAPLQQDLEQVRLDRQDRLLRENIRDLAEKDPRVLNPNVFAAITAKLDAEPDLWKLKNPHKAAWLDIKDELRLGEPSHVPAQPSRPPSPILGGGTPPPTPSSSEGMLSVDTLLQAASRIGRDPRDGVKSDAKQHQAMNLAAKELFDKMDRQARR